MSRRITRAELESLGQDTELVTLNEAAEALDISFALVHRWVRSGAIPWAAVGGQLMIPLVLASWYQRDQDHGYAAYRRGCRCSRCRGAYAAYRRAERAKRRAESGAPELTRQACVQ